MGENEQRESKENTNFGYYVVIMKLAFPFFSFRGRAWLEHVAKQCKFARNYSAT